MPTLALLGLLLAIFYLVCTCFDQHQAVNFAEEWPSIDEDEFVRRCPPGVRRETALKVRKVISESLDVPYDQIYPEHSLIDDLGCE